MKPITEKVPYEQDNIVFTKEATTPEFEYVWHQHVEFELLLFKKGSGITYIGNHIGQFEKGDVYFIGSNIPHVFEKGNKESIATCVVVQFNKDSLGEAFNELNELKEISKLYEKSMFGIKIQDEKDKEFITKLILKMNNTSGLSKLTTLLECLDYISKIKELPTLNNLPAIYLNNKETNRIDKVCNYTIENYNKKITLDDVAGLVYMSVPAFCKFFKKSTRKTYIQFLNEVKIEHACKLLHDTELSVNEIAFNCGYNTLANFHKQFFKIKNTQPHVYRKLYLSIAQ